MLKMAKEFIFYGKNLEELQNMPLNEFMRLLPSARRRVLSRGFTDQQKIFLNKIRKVKEIKSKKLIKTHLRNMIILPEMVGLIIAVYNGKEFVNVNIIQEMIGGYLGEYVMTRKKVEHSAPGIGATRSSSAVSVRT